MAPCGARQAGWCAHGRAGPSNRHTQPRSPACCRYARVASWMDHNRPPQGAAVVQLPTLLDMHDYLRCEAAAGSPPASTARPRWAGRPFAGAASLPGRARDNTARAAIIYRNVSFKEIVAKRKVLETERFKLHFGPVPSGAPTVGDFVVKKLCQRARAISVMEGRLQDF